MARRLVRKIAIGLFVFSCSWTILFVFFVDPEDTHSLSSWFSHSSAHPGARAAPIDRPAPEQLRGVTNAPLAPIVAAFVDANSTQTSSSSALSTARVLRTGATSRSSARRRRASRDPFDVWDSRGVSVQFAVPECPPTNASAPELAQQSFQPLEPSGTSAFFYSAFSDHRSELAVRVVGVAQRVPLGDLRCQLYYGSVRKSAVGAPSIALEQLHLADAFYALVPEGLPKR